MVYPSEIANVEQLKENIITAFATSKLENNTLENVRRSLIRTAQLCMQQLPTIFKLKTTGEK